MVTPTVNADPLAVVQTTGISGQGSEVGTYSTSCGGGDGPASVDTQPRAPGSVGGAATPSQTGEGAGHRPGPHDTLPAFLDRRQKRAPAP